MFLILHFEEIGYEFNKVLISKVGNISGLIGFNVDVNL
jgi:hypothetical protein